MNDAVAPTLLITQPSPDSPAETSPAPAWHSLGIVPCATQLQADLVKGLSPLEAGLRLQRFGANRLAAKKPRSLWFKFFDQFKNLLVGILVGAALLAGAVGDLEVAARLDEGCGLTGFLHRCVG